MVFPVLEGDELESMSLDLAGSELQDGIEAAQQVLVPLYSSMPFRGQVR